MKRGSKVVSSAILGKDFETVFVNGKAYVLTPPTIHKIAGAGYYLSGLSEASTVVDMIRSIKDIGDASRALSCFIQGNEDLYEELSQGSLDEVVDALLMAYSMISIENFQKLSSLAKNVAALIANARQ